MARPQPRFRLQLLGKILATRRPLSNGAPATSISRFPRVSRLRPVEMTLVVVPQALHTQDPGDRQSGITLDTSRFEQRVRPNHQ